MLEMLLMRVVSFSEQSSALAVGRYGRGTCYKLFEASLRRVARTAPTTGFESFQLRAHARGNRAAVGGSRVAHRRRRSDAARSQRERSGGNACTSHTCHSWGRALGPGAPGSSSRHPKRTLPVLPT